ncbi:MAG: hypothetical protein WC370_08840 [Dehalococcoidales bacterium]
MAKLDYSAIPQKVIDNAARIAKKAVRSSREKTKAYADELLSTYIEARAKDVVIFFNSGGMGWNLTKDTPGWAGILDAIKAQLVTLGYQPLVLNYRRTGSGLRSSIREFFEAAYRYPQKTKDLARRVEFLIDNLPALKIIIAGESTGTVISEKTMRVLRDRQNVYSIQTGMPFWHRPVVQERTLSMNSNGSYVDTFSNGQLRAMLWATAKSWFGRKNHPGTILSWLKAPGHDYSWQYPGVSSAVIKFLESNFAAK